MLSSLTAAPMPPAVMPASTSMLDHRLPPDGGLGRRAGDLAGRSEVDVDSGGPRASRSVSGSPGRQAAGGDGD